MLLHLTSPHTKNDHVRAVQRVLKKKHYLQGAVDGEFGPDTARAVHRAKYWLGYAKPDQYAGDQFWEFLTGKKKLTPAMQMYVRRRLKLAKQTPMRVKMLNEAKRHNGEKERTGHNDIFYSDWYGVVGPWCAMFVTYCGTKAGSKVFKKSQRYAYVPYIVNDAKAGRNNLAITYNPQMGDLVCFDWEHNGVADHIGFFISWAGGGRMAFRSIEGNTAVGNNSNGGQVMYRDRKKLEVQAFVHVGR